MQTQFYISEDFIQRIRAARQAHYDERCQDAFSNSCATGRMTALDWQDELLQWDKEFFATLKPGHYDLQTTEKGDLGHLAYVLTRVSCDELDPVDADNIEALADAAMKLYKAGPLERLAMEAE